MADRRIKEVLGPIERGWWNEATIGFSQQGHSVSCTFPVYGEKGSAEIRLKAIRVKGKAGTIKLFHKNQAKKEEIKLQLASCRVGY